MAKKKKIETPKTIQVEKKSNLNKYDILIRDGKILGKVIKTGKKLTIKKGFEEIKIDTPEIVKITPVKNASFRYVEVK